jgi:hypothetical protein
VPGIEATLRKIEANVVEIEAGVPEIDAAVLSNEAGDRQFAKQRPLVAAFPRPMV